MARVRESVEIQEELGSKRLKVENELREIFKFEENLRLNDTPLNIKVGDNPGPFIYNKESLQHEDPLEVGITIANGWIQRGIIAHMLPENDYSERISTPYLAIWEEFTRDNEIAGISNQLMDQLGEAYLSGDSTILDRKLVTDKPNNKQELTIREFLTFIGKTYKELLENVTPDEIDEKIAFYVNREEGVSQIDPTVFQVNKSLLRRTALFGMAAVAGLLLPHMPIDINKNVAAHLGTAAFIVSFALTTLNLTKYTEEVEDMNEKKDVVLTAAVLKHLFTNPENGKVGIGRFE